jgi:hypothetical protein
LQLTEQLIWNCLYPVLAVAQKYGNLEQRDRAERNRLGPPYGCL